jgi:hypothetical protein
MAKCWFRKMEGKVWRVGGKWYFCGGPFSSPKSTTSCNYEPLKVILKTTTQDKWKYQNLTKLLSQYLKF